MKPINSKFKPLNENAKNLVTQSSTSSINELKNNKNSLNLTNSTNFSNEQSKIKKINLRKNENTKIGLKKPIISISTPHRENTKRKENPIKLTPLLPTNANSFQHLITGPFGIFENINWALGLRGRPRRTNNEISKEKINITETFKEPPFYLEDLVKYKKKQTKKYDAKIEKLNPNYNKIKHLVLGGGTGNINYSQFNFSTCLRDYNSKDNKNIEKEKNWKYTPLPKIKSDCYVVKCLSPVTQAGKENCKKLENIMPKNYEVIHGEAFVGKDKIKTKKLVNNRSYTVSGYGGECLGDKKYNNKFGDNNMFANKNILRVASNPLSKFELGLRIYGSLKNIKNYNKSNIIK